MGRVRRVHTRVGVLLSSHVRRHHRSGVTELSGLPSDPICTADRRGGILISSGPNCSPGRVLSPSNRVDRGSGVAGRYRPGQATSAFHSDALLQVRASDQSGLAGRASALRHCASDPMGRVDLRPSNRNRRVMRLHDPRLPGWYLESDPTLRPPYQISSRCSTPFFETFPSVISSTCVIQTSSCSSASHSVISTSGGDSFHAQAS